MTRFRFVEDEAAQFPVSLLCRVVGCTRQGFYAWRREPPSARELADRELDERIREIYAETEEIYRRAADLLRAEASATGITVGRKRVARLMRQLGLRGADGRRRGGPTHDDPRSRRGRRRRTSSTATFARAEPNRLWVCDLKYVQTGQGFLFLAAVQDVFSRRIIGWSMRDDLKAELVLDALGMAVSPRGDAAGVVAHSDHGSQYTSLVYGSLRQAVRDRPLDGLDRRPLGQRRSPRRSSPASRKNSSAANDSQTREQARMQDLLVHRMLLQPPPQALQPRHAQPDRLRTTTPTGGHRGLDPRCQRKRVNSNNRLTETTNGITTITSSYNAADQLTSSTDGTTTTNYTYDANGNQATAGAATYTYDLSNHQTSATTSGVTSTYAYDGAGNRTQSTTPSGADIRYSWDPLAETGIPEIALERDTSGNLIRRYLTTPIGATSMTTSAGAFYYQHDPRGDITDVTNSTGTAQLYYDYDPSGTTRAAGSLVGSPPENRLQFDGQYNDPETGLYDLRARMYTPTTGLFGAVDPLQPTLGEAAFGTYGYTAGMPLRFEDPAGKSLISFPRVCFGSFCSTEDFGDPRDAAYSGADSVGSAATLGGLFGRWKTNHLASDEGDRLGVGPNRNTLMYRAGPVVATAVMTVAPGAGELRLADCVTSAGELATEGIYIIRGADSTYVGQSGDIATRLAQHLRSGLYTAEEINAAERVEVLGGKTAREVAEQKKIDDLREAGETLLNERNPIGQRRIHLMGPGYTRFGR